MDFERIEAGGYTGSIRLICSCGQSGGRHEFPLYNAAFPELGDIIRETIQDKGDVHD